MPSRRNRKSHALATRAVGIALEAPQVFAHRVARMWFAGSSPSARDHREFHRMGAEKAAAFYESWNAMLSEVVRANVRFALSSASFWWWPMRPSLHSRRTYAHVRRTAFAVAGKGLIPVHRRVLANAKRLRRIGAR